MTAYDIDQTQVYTRVRVRVQLLAREISSTVRVLATVFTRKQLTCECNCSIHPLLASLVKSCLLHESIESGPPEVPVNNTREDPAK